MQSSQIKHFSVRVTCKLPHPISNYNQGRIKKLEKEKILKIEEDIIHGYCQGFLKKELRVHRVGIRILQISS